MMMHGCRCPHHVLNMVLALFAWVAAIGFWWAAWQAGVFWQMQTLAWSAVLFVLLAFSTKFCGCCRHGGMHDWGTKEKGMWHGAPYCDHDNGVCRHGGDCKCGGCKACM